MDKKQIKLVIMDVDGCLTDGKIYTTSDGGHMRAFCTRDGFFIKEVCPKIGIEFGIITGSRLSKSVEARAEVLKIKYVATGKMDKEKAFLDIAKEAGVTLEETAYIGDEWFDWTAMKHAGVSGCPNNAVDAIKERADYVCESYGGNGAIREFLEWILKKDGRFEEALSLYFD